MSSHHNVLNELDSQLNIDRNSQNNNIDFGLNIDHNDDVHSPVDNDNYNYDNDIDNDGNVPDHILADDYTSKYQVDDADVLDIDLATLSLLTNKDGKPYTSLNELIKDVEDHPHHALKMSNAIDIDLQSLPSGVINTYLSQAEELVHLHKVIDSNDLILSEIGDVFKSFDDELQNLIKDMPDTHITTQELSQALANRMLVKDAISRVVKKIIIPPDLISGINKDDINEDYIKYIEALEHRIESLDDFMSSEAMFAQDMAFEIDLLKKKASRQVRDFMLKLIISLRKPRTNVQILQHSKLFKYSALNHFIYKYSPLFAVEIKQLYTETVSRIFMSYFKSYSTSLAKVYFPIGTKSDVVGWYDNVVKGYFGTTTKQVDTNKASAFNLNISNLPNDIWTSIRSEVISEIPEKINQNLLRRSHMIIRATDAPLIIPHAAIKNNKKYPLEQIFRSMNILLLDTVCSEYIFTQQWFARPLVSNQESSGIIKPIFDNIFNVFYENVFQYVSNSFDCLGILISIKLNQILMELLKERKLSIPCLSAYFYKVDIILWDKFSELFKRNIDSLKLALTNNNGAIDLRPHIYTRRFSEFYTSVSEIIGNTVADSRVTAWMAVLRSSMERVLLHMAQNFPDTKNKSIFLINNYDVVITVLSENNISFKEDGYSQFKELLDEQINIYLEEQLFSYFKALITFIKDVESKIINSPTTTNTATNTTVSTYIIDKDVLNGLIGDFTSRWREVLQRIQIDIMNAFSNFNIGSEITKKLIAQFLIYYKRFEEIFKKSNKQTSTTLTQPKANFIPISTITYEISKNFSVN